MEHIKDPNVNQELLTPSLELRQFKNDSALTKNQSVFNLPRFFVHPIGESRQIQN